MWSVFLACSLLLVRGASSSPLKWQGQGERASTAEVNVLMYGVLQLSETLHHAYRNTGARLERVTNAVQRTESLVQRLGHVTEQAVHVDGEIKERLGHIQSQMAALQVQTQQTRGLVNKVEQEEVELKQKLTSLEQSLSSSSPDRINALKDMTQKHNTVLKDLITWTKEHKEHLEKQNKQLAELHKQTSDVL